MTNAACLVIFLFLNCVDIKDVHLQLMEDSSEEVAEDSSEEAEDDKLGALRVAPEPETDPDELPDHPEDYELSLPPGWPAVERPNTEHSWPSGQGPDFRPPAGNNNNNNKPNTEHSWPSGQGPDFRPPAGNNNNNNKQPVVLPPRQPSVLPTSQPTGIGSSNNNENWQPNNQENWQPNSQENWQPNNQENWQPNNQENWQPHNQENWQPNNQENWQPNNQENWQPNNQENWQPNNQQNNEPTWPSTDGHTWPSGPGGPTTPSVTACGRNQNQAFEENRYTIVNGTLSSVEEWPWAVILGVPAPPGSIKVMCGGTLIGWDTVLTASHCFMKNDKPTTVRVGSSTSQASSDAQDIPISKVVEHPEFDSTTLDNDIAILKLQRSATPAKTVKLACLPHAYEGQNLLTVLNGENENATVVGWGALRSGEAVTPIIREAEVPVVEQARCQTIFQKLANFEIDENKFCAGGSNPDTCNGDSGGPLLSNNLADDKAYSVVGITSFGIGCGQPGIPAVYTRVDRYLPWIEDQL